VKAPRSALICTACLLALALAGCDSAPVRHPDTTQKIVLSPDDASPTVEIPVDSAIHVVLPGPDAASGLVWEIASNNNRVLEQMEPLRAVSEPGQATTTEASFYALGPGKSVLRFFLVRPQEAEAIPAASYVVTVRVRD
jgi:hypothetical protein